MKLPDKIITNFLFSMFAAEINTADHNNPVEHHQYWYYSIKQYSLFYFLLFSLNIHRFQVIT